MEPLVALFDIDGTLVRTGGAGRRAMDEAFAYVTKQPEGLADVRFSGMTDRGILRAGFENLGETLTEARFDEVMSDYLIRLRRYVPISPGYQVMPGVHGILSACQEAGVAMGLGTGNVEAAARVKLDRAELSSFFTFGGFGSDAEDRAELLRIGARRGFDSIGGGARVVVIGDTPLDVRAARAIGAKVIAVATGTFSFDELAASEPDATFESLTVPGALDAVLS